LENRNEILLLLLVTAIILVLGIIALIIVNTTNLGTSGLTEESNPIDEVIEHASNWIMWLIFGVVLIIGIALYLNFMKKPEDNS
jgi:hypothetical protein